MIIIPATLEGINTLKDGSIKITFETQELKPSDVGSVFALRKNICYLAIKPETFQSDQIELIQSLKVSEFENEKSDSKRMRNILFRLWEQDKCGYTDFNLFYKYRMNNLCEMLKSEFNK